MKIYIAGSWRYKNEIIVLTSILRKAGAKVLSWIENNEANGAKNGNSDWVKTDEAQRCFNFDTMAATTSDLVIYYGGSGKDACCELGIAYGSGVNVVGLWNNKEDLGLMRKLVKEWFFDVGSLVKYVKNCVKNFTTSTEIKEEIAVVLPVVDVQRNASNYSVYVNERLFVRRFNEGRWMEFVGLKYLETTNEENSKMLENAVNIYSKRNLKNG